MHFVKSNAASLSYLDRMRLYAGSQKCRSSFFELVQKHREQAILHINASSLHFATLFSFLPEIAAPSFYESLNQRNQTALEILARISADFKAISHAGTQVLKDERSVHDVLRWIVQTGVADDGLSDTFDQILDTAATLLLRKNGDPDLLQDLVRLLFQRNRKGRYIHDLVWALFQSRNPDCLRFIAQYLRSPHKKDVSLAQTLLRYNSKSGATASKQWQYASFAPWFQENRPYLVFTGDNFNRTNEPSLFRVDLDAKYLAAEQPLQQPGASDLLTPDGHACLAAFHGATDTEQRLLAKYSCRLHNRNKGRWQKWMACPVEKQIRIAQGRQGERL